MGILELDEYLLYECLLNEYLFLLYKQNIILSFLEKKIFLKISVSENTFYMFKEIKFESYKDYLKTIDSLTLSYLKKIFPQIFSHLFTHVYT